MAGVTPINGWDYPTSSDLVKDGALNIQTLATDIETSVGSGLIAWTSYTPTFTNFTLGNGTITVAKYSKLGKIVTVKLLVTMGSTSSVSGRIGISLPATATSDYLNTNIAPARLSAGGVSAQGFVVLGSTTMADLYAILASGTYTTSTNISSTIPGTWTTSSTFGGQFTYEAA